MMTIHGYTDGSLKHHLIRARSPLGAHRVMQSYILCALWCVLVTSLTLSSPWATAQPAEERPVLSTAYKLVKGELVRIEGHYYVLKDDQGKEMHLLVGPDTVAQGSFRTGDRIEVSASPIEHAMFIKPLSQRHVEIDLEAATRTIRGRFIKIEGKYYVLKDPAGHEYRLLVTASTEMVGAFSPGDDLEVAVSPVEHAMSIRSNP